MFSLVVDDSRNRRRRLPSLYIGSIQVFASRELATLLERLQHVLDSTIAAQDETILVLEACRLGDRIGLYARDFCNREHFRRKLVRAGIEFSGDPYLRLLPTGQFWFPGWGEFRPSFVILNRELEEPTEVSIEDGAYVWWTLAAHRVGRNTPQDLTSLRAALSDAVAIGSGNAQSLVNHLLTNA